MIFEFNGRGHRRSSTAHDRELDALVAHEVDALSSRIPQPALRRRATDDDPASSKATAATRPRSDRSDVDKGSAARTRRHGAANPQAIDEETIGSSHAIAVEEEASGALFSAEEEAFIEQTIAFLRGRENADVLIEQVWSRTVFDEEDPMEASLDAQENLPAEIPGSPPERAVQSAPPPLDDGAQHGTDDRSQRGAIRADGADEATNFDGAKSGAQKPANERRPPPSGRNRGK